MAMSGNQREKPYSSVGLHSVKIVAIPNYMFPLMSTSNQELALFTQVLAMVYFAQERIIPTSCRLGNERNRAPIEIAA